MSPLFPPWNTAIGGESSDNGMRMGLSDRGSLTISGQVCLDYLPSDAMPITGFYASRSFGCIVYQRSVIGIHIPTGNLVFIYDGLTESEVFTGSYVCTGENVLLMSNQRILSLSWHGTLLFSMPSADAMALTEHANLACLTREHMGMTLAIHPLVQRMVDEDIWIGSNGWWQVDQNAIMDLPSLRFYPLQYDHYMRYGPISRLFLNHVTDSPLVALPKGLLAIRFVPNHTPLLVLDTVI